MSSTEQRAGEPKPANKEYTEIIKSAVEVDKKFVEGTGQPAKIVYFCRDCKKLVPPKRIGKKFQFSCSLCNGTNVAFGSEQAIHNYFKINAEGVSKK